MENLDNNKIPFPQANDFNKVVSIIHIDRPEQINENDYLESFLGISQRQVHYYLSACQFLGIIDKKRCFTPYGILLRNSGKDSFEESLAMKIISLPVFGEVFFRQYFHNEKMETEEISELITFHYSLDNSDVADRRASTVRNWVKWITDKRAVSGKIEL